VSQFKPNDAKNLKVFHLTIAETTDAPNSFFIYLESKDPKHVLDLDKKLKDGCHAQDLTVGEFYAFKLKDVVMEYLEKLGVIKTKIQLGDLDKELSN
jgi:hypothetical protein